MEFDLNETFSRLLEQELPQVMEEAVRRRRHLHMHPEVSFDTRETERAVRQWLTEAGIEILPSKIGVTAQIPGRDRSRMVALRADMDALPMTEENDVPYRSQVPGKMHACGHDGHTAMLLGAGEVLSRHRDQLPMDVLLIFQPAEEGPSPGGARVMVDDLRQRGLTDRIVRVFGQHLFNNFPVGTVGWRSGPLFSSTDNFELQITGRGGHAGQPQNTIDALSIGAKVVTALESYMSRRMDPFDNAVLSIGIFHAGSVRNVVPETAHIAGTIRCQREETRGRIIEDLRRIVNGICSAFGAGCQLDVIPGLPVLINEEETTGYARAVAERTVGPERTFRLSRPTMSAEDFTFFARAIPGSFLILGSGNEEKGLTYLGHSPRFDFDEDAMATGIRMLCNLAVNIDKL